MTVNFVVPDECLIEIKTDGKNWNLSVTPKKQIIKKINFPPPLVGKLMIGRKRLIEPPIFNDLDGTDCVKRLNF